jgi:hypothetical protein
LLTLIYSEMAAANSFTLRNVPRRCGLLVIP